MANPKAQARLLSWLAALVTVGGVVVAFITPVGRMQTCIEFEGCHMTKGASSIGIMVVAFILSGLLLAGASAAKNRWRRDARYWNPTDSH
jgi:hypothetical protein